MRGRPDEAVVKARHAPERGAQRAVAGRGEVLRAEADRAGREARERVAAEAAVGPARDERVVSQHHDPVVVTVEHDLLEDARHVARRADVLVLRLAVGPVGRVDEPPRGVECDQPEALRRRRLARPARLVARREDVGVEGVVQEVFEALEAVLALAPVAVAGDHDHVPLDAVERRNEGTHGRLGGGAGRVVVGRNAVGRDIAEEGDGGVLPGGAGVGSEGPQDGVGAAVGEVAGVAGQEHAMRDLAVGQRRDGLRPALGSDVGGGRGAPAAEGQECEERKQSAHAA